MDPRAGEVGREVEMVGEVGAEDVDLRHDSCVLLLLLNTFIFNTFNKYNKYMFIKSNTRKIYLLIKK